MSTAPRQALAERFRAFQTPRATGPYALVMEDLVVAHGSIEAVHGISLHVAPGEAVAILGANGAGKSTLLRAISGLMRPRRGTITFAGVDITGCPANQILRLGIAHVPEGRMIFAQQTVRENLLLGQLIRKDKARAREELDHLLDVFPALRSKLDQAAGALSGGQQQMLAIARGLMADPKLLLLDEPSLGLAPVLVDEVAELIARLRREQQMGLLLVEQNPFIATEITERVYILQTGLIRSELRSAEVMDNMEILAAYLGGSVTPAL